MEFGRRRQSEGSGAEDGRRSSLSSSFSEGTSRFFSSVIARKNGLLNDLSSKFESVGASLMKNSPSSSSYSSDGESEQGLRNKKYQSRKGKERSLVTTTTNIDGTKVIHRRLSKQESSSDYSDTGSVNEDPYPSTTINMSFDEPLYSPGKTTSVASSKVISASGKVTTGFSKGKTETIPVQSEVTPSSNTSASRESSGNGPVDPSASGHGISSLQNLVKATKLLKTAMPASKVAAADGRSSAGPTGRSYAGPDSRSSASPEGRSSASPDGRSSAGPASPYKDVTVCSSQKQSAVDPKTEQSNNENTNGNIGDEERKRAPMLTTIKRRSSTVDEMLFDDYVEPEETKDVKEEEPSVSSKRKTLLPMGDLISFDEPELEDFKPRTKKHQQKVEETSEKKRSPYPSVSSIESSDLEFGSSFNQTSVDSSDVEFGGSPGLHRSGSLDSERSWSSSYSTDSQPDDLTLESMAFMKSFVEKIFDTSEEILQTEKATFGEFCQMAPGRLWFARYVNTQRVNKKNVEEQIFFRLVQYFATVLFECNEAEDFSPAKSLMNMCFTFYHESLHGQIRYKNFLYSYLREQPIWRSLRFWNAAFFDAVQNERARKPVSTRDDGTDTQTDDNQFQENITFGQLGTFTCNMRAFGLSRELCLEFLRKQCTIANLKDEQVQMLKENVDKWRDH